VKPDLKRMLHELVAARRQYRKSFLERKVRQVRRLGGQTWLAALDRAVGRSVQRKRAAADLLAEMTDLPEVVDRFTAWLTEGGLAWRAEMIAFIGQKGLAEFAPLLNDALDGKADDLCRAYAVTAAEELRAEANLPALLWLASDTAYDPLFRRLLPALTAYADPRCRPALERFFRKDQPKPVRVFAAWGLGKIGDRAAIRYLADMLDDPDIHTPTSFEPGESFRAAQALCDIHGWPFEWDRSWVAKTKRRWQRLQQGGTGGD